MLNKLLKGGKTTTQRAIIEAVYLVVSAAVVAGLSAVVNNPAVFSVTTVAGARVILGIVANLSSGV